MPLRLINALGKKTQITEAQLFPATNEIRPTMLALTLKNPEWAQNRYNFNASLRQMQADNALLEINADGLRTDVDSSLISLRGYRRLPEQHPNQAPGEFTIWFFGKKNDHRLKQAYSKIINDAEKGIIPPIKTTLSAYETPANVHDENSANGRLTEKDFEELERHAMKRAKPYDYLEKLRAFNEYYLKRETRRSTKPGKT